MLTARKMAIEAETATDAYQTARANAELLKAESDKKREELYDLLNRELKDGQCIVCEHTVFIKEDGIVTDYEIVLDTRKEEPNHGR
jgi:hypothetical protein